MPSHRGKTRRQFLAELATAAAGASAAGLAGCFPDVGGSWACLDSSLGAALSPPLSSQVVEVTRQDSVVGGAVQEAAMRPMLDAALNALAGSESPWPALLPGAGPTTRVGIKVNCLNGGCATRVPLVKALVDSLKEGLGLDAAHIVVWDRTSDELATCGFTQTSTGATVMATLSTDPGVQGPGYGAPYCGVAGGPSMRLSRILTDLTDLTINVPVLKTHGVSGVTAGLKNIYGLFHNPSDYHANLVEALPRIYALPAIRGHIKLTVVDALIAVMNGGTSSPADAVPQLIFAGTDPLSVDSHALQVVNGLRAGKSLAPVDSTLTQWLQTASGLGLGALQFQLTSVVQ